MPWFLSFCLGLLVSPFSLLSSRNVLHHMIMLERRTVDVGRFLLVSRYIGKHLFSVGTTIFCNGKPFAFWGLSYFVRMIGGDSNKCRIDLILEFLMYLKSISWGMSKGNQPAVPQGPKSDEPLNENGAVSSTEACHGMKVEM
jgi:hypothetical protein